MSEQIIDAIEAKLSGNIDEDFKFVLSEAFHLKKLGMNHLIKDVFIVFEKRYGDEGKKYLISKAKETLQLRKADFDKIIKLEKEGKFLEAQEIAVKLIDTLPEFPKKNENSVVKSFRNLVEETYYKEYIDKEHFILRFSEPISAYYYHVAFCLMRMNDFEGSIEQLDNALKYNDVFSDSYILKAHNYLNLNDTVKFEYNLKRALEYAYTKETFQNIYMHLFRHYYSQKKKKECYAFYFAAKFFMKLPLADNEKIRNAIDELDGEVIEEKDFPKIASTIEECGYTFGLSKSMSIILRKLLASDKSKNDIRFRLGILSIVYDVTKDPKVFKQIEALKNKIEKETQVK